MATTLSKSDLDHAIADLKASLATKEQLSGLATKEQLSGLATKEQLSGVEENMKEGVREIIQHFNESQGGQTKHFNERFDQTDAKLAAIMEMLAMRQELRNLLRELKASGITIDESKVLVS